MKIVKIAIICVSLCLSSTARGYIDDDDNECLPSSDGRFFKTVTVGGPHGPSIKMVECTNK